MSDTISLNTSACVFSFCIKTGAVTSCTFGDKNMLVPAEHFFTLGLRSDTGDLEILPSGDFRFEYEADGGNALAFRHSGHPRYSALEVRTAIRAEKGFFHFRPEVKNIPAGFLLEWIDVPRIVVPANGRIFWPHAEGVLIDRPEAREASPWSRYHVLGFLGRTEGIAYSEGGYYPGVCPMQFLSWEKDGAVLYFGAHDFSHGTKAVEFAPQKDGNCRLSLQTFCGGADPYRSSFDYVFCVMEGDWRDACAVYRDWIADDPAMPRKGDLPEMVRESPVVMIYPVRGHGDDKGRMTVGNEYFPYENGMPVTRKLAEAFDSRILSLLMHWEGTAPWAPPYVWPPFGGAGLLKKYAEQLHEAGHYLGVYCSGTAWTQRSCITDYSREKECEEQGLRKHMIRGPKGEIEAVICNGEQSQRIGFDLCLTEEWSRKTLIGELNKLTECDIDYAQFFDQNLGGGYHTCYSREHRHPGVPGAWQTEAMKSLLDGMIAELRQKNSKMILGCEAASADAFLKELPFNDLRACWNWSRGIPVPGYQFVFHEYVNNFMGNQCGIADTIDCKASPENQLYRIACSFSAGDLLSVVLKDGGQIHWGWGALWEMPGPGQESVLTLIRNLNAARKKHGKFLQYGRMEKPRLETAGETFPLHAGGRILTMDAFLHSSWTAPDGQMAEIIANFLPAPQTVRCKARRGFRMTVNGKPRESEIFELKPLDALCITVEKEE